MLASCCRPLQVPRCRPPHFCQRAFHESEWIMVVKLIGVQHWLCAWLLSPQPWRHSLLSSPSMQRLLKLWPHHVIAPQNPALPWFPETPSPVMPYAFTPILGSRNTHTRRQTPQLQEVSFRPQLNGDLVFDRAVTWSSGFPRASGHPSQGTVSMGRNPPHPVVSPWKSRRCWSTHLTQHLPQKTRGPE